VWDLRHRPQGTHTPSFLVPTRRATRETPRADPPAVSPRLSPPPRVHTAVQKNCAERTPAPNPKPEILSPSRRVSPPQKVKEAGFATVKSLLTVPKKTLIDVKGLSDAKVDKMLEAACKLLPAVQAGGFVTAGEWIVMVRQFGVQGRGLRVAGSGIGIWGLGFTVYGSGIGV